MYLDDWLLSTSRSECLQMIQNTISKGENMGIAFNRKNSLPFPLSIASVAGHELAQSWSPVRIEQTGVLEENIPSSLLKNIYMPTLGEPLKLQHLCCRGYSLGETMALSTSLGGKPCCFKGNKRQSNPLSHEPLTKTQIVDWKRAIKIPGKPITSKYNRCIRLRMGVPVFQRTLRKWSFCMLPC